MASKTYTLFVEGEDAVDYGSKKTAVKYGDESGKTYQVHSPSGATVHAVAVEAEAPVVPGAIAPEENLIGDLEDPEVTFFEVIDFPGNYSIVTAPLAVEIAEAAGVPTKVENVPGKLNRKVFFGGTDKDRAQAVVALVNETVAGALSLLRVWQKENVERRRGLTDMQRYVEHRKFIAAHGTEIAKQVKKGVLL